MALLIVLIRHVHGCDVPDAAQSSAPAALLLTNLAGLGTDATPACVCPALSRHLLRQYCPNISKLLPFACTFDLPPFQLFHPHFHITWRKYQRQLQQWRCCTEAAFTAAACTHACTAGETGQRCRSAPADLPVEYAHTHTYTHIHTHARFKPSLVGFSDRCHACFNAAGQVVEQIQDLVTSLLLTLADKQDACCHATMQVAGVGLRQDLIAAITGGPLRAAAATHCLGPWELAEAAGSPVMHGKKSKAL
eukprot:scaffold101656_cov21-Tisochrysis_lutea.AAC.4